jgi:hypothetical protein
MQSAPLPHLNAFAHRTANAASSQSPGNSSGVTGAVPRFSGNAALTQFAINTLGTTAPKVVVARTPAQLAEDVFLQLIEDSAICFSIGLSAKYWFAPLVQGLYQLSKVGIKAEDLGKNIAVLGNKASNNHLIAGKMGVLVASVALMHGIVYLTPYLKNVMSAHVFKTKNFSAIAGLEGKKDQLSADEVDPLLLAKKRVLPIVLVTMGAIATGLALPKLLLNNPKAINASKALLKWFDFGKNKPFELSKPLVVSVFVPGFLSYVDSARDMLEKLEIATRLAFIFPYQAAGKELTGNWLARIFQQQTMGGGTTGIAPFKMVDKVSLLDKTLFQKESWLDFNRVKSAQAVFKEVQALNLPAEVASAITRAHTFAEMGAFGLSASLMGAGISLLAFAQTRSRFKQRQQQTVAKQAVPTNISQSKTPKQASITAPYTIAMGNGATRPFGSQSAFTVFDGATQSP